MIKNILVAGLIFVAAQAQAALLADNSGRTVYVFDKDQGSTSVCYDACVQAWPVVTSMPGNVNGLGLTTRRDGTQQITLNGRPLYYYVGDQNPGDANGDGLGGIWHVINE